MSIPLLCCLGAGANLLFNSVRNISVYLPWYLHTPLTGHCLAGLPWYLLVYVDSVLRAYCLRELSTLLPWDIYRNILALFVRNISALCSRNLSVNIFRNLLALLFWYLSKKSLTSVLFVYILPSHTVDDIHGHDTAVHSL